MTKASLQRSIEIVLDLAYSQYEQDKENDIDERELKEELDAIKLVSAYYGLDYSQNGRN